MLTFSYIIDETLLNDRNLSNILTMVFYQLQNHRLPFWGFLILQVLTQFLKTVFFNHILLIFKIYVNKSREKKININNLIAEIWNAKNIEKEIASKNPIAFT